MRRATFQRWSPGRRSADASPAGRFPPGPDFPCVLGHPLLDHGPRRFISGRPRPALVRPRLMCHGGTPPAMANTSASGFGRRPPRAAEQRPCGRGGTTLAGDNSGHLPRGWRQKKQPFGPKWARQIRVRHRRRRKGRPLQGNKLGRR